MKGTGLVDRQCASRSDFFLFGSSRRRRSWLAVLERGGVACVVLVVRAR